MANCRLSMRKITEALRLHHECNRSHREIASAIGASPTTVSQYLRRAREAGIGYPPPADMERPPLSPASSRRCYRRRSSAQNQTGHGCIASYARRASRSTCCGKNTRPIIRRASATAGSANITGNGRASCPSACGRRIPPARSCLLIMQARRSRSLMVPPVKSRRHQHFG